MNLLNYSDIVLKVDYNKSQYAVKSFHLLISKPKHTCTQMFFLLYVLGSIQTAAQLFSFAEKELTIPLVCNQKGHKTRTFLWMDKFEREAQQLQLNTLKGTMKTHDVKSGGDGKTILHRELSCFCTGCLSNEVCINSDFVEDYKSFKVIKEPANPDAKEKCRGSKSDQNGKTSKQEGLWSERKIKQEGQGSERKTRQDGQGSEKKTKKESQGSKCEPLSEGQGLQHEGQGAQREGLRSSTKRKAAPEKETERPKTKRVKRDLKSETKVKAEAATSLVEKVENKVKRRRCLENTNQCDVQRVNGPVPIADITAELIHSPFELKLTICNSIPENDIVIKEDLSLLGINASVDAMSLQLYNTRTIPGVSKYPIIIEGDGNCLPRCGSVLAFGMQDKHAEIRLRIAMELITFSELYLSAEYLERGWDPAQGQRPTPTLFAMFSEGYSNQHLSEGAIRELYQKEVNDILMEGTYMGIWQLFALASVLKCPIFSVYPMKGCPAVRDDLHRLILPREANTMVPRFILWSCTRDDLPEQYWRPNHFSVCLPWSPVAETAIATDLGCGTSIQKTDW